MFVCMYVYTQIHRCECDQQSSNNFLSGLANDWEAQTSAADIRACEISLLNLKAAPFWPKNGLRSNLIASKFDNFFQGRVGGWVGGMGRIYPQTPLAV